MEKTYEGLFILNVTGKEEGSKELVEKLEKEIQAVKGKTLKIERMDKRPFSRVAQQLDSGYYVNIVFEMTPEKLNTFRNKLKHDEDVFRAMFLNSEPKSFTVEKAAA
jgi:small subunit ribosomal protein S6